MIPRGAEGLEEPPLDSAAMTTAAAAAVEAPAPAADGRTPRRPPAIYYVRSTSTPAVRFAEGFGHSPTAWRTGQIDTSEMRAFEARAVAPIVASEHAAILDVGVHSKSATQRRPHRPAGRRRSWHDTRCGRRAATRETPQNLLTVYDAMMTNRCASGSLLAILNPVVPKSPGHSTCIAQRLRLRARRRAVGLFTDDRGQ
jgi:hypothetical protein